MNAHYSIKGSRLVFGDGTEITFSIDIDKVVEVANVLLVLLVFPPDAGMNENVYGVKDGKVLWQVEPRDTLHAFAPYSGVIVRGCDVTLYGGDGVDIYIDVQTGKFIGSQLVK